MNWRSHRRKPRSATSFAPSTPPRSPRSSASGCARARRERTATRSSPATKILNEHGLAVPNWPVEWGGKDWTPTQHQIWADEMQLACVPEPLTFNTKMVGPVIAEFGSRGDQAALPAADGQPRHLVVPGLLRARGRLRPGLAAHHRGPRRRQLRRQRPEDLDHARPVRRLDLLPGAHRPAGAQAAGRHLVPAHRHEDAGHHGAADQDDRRRPRGQRGVLRRRPRARRSACRRREPGLDVREVPARQRAHRHRRRRADQSAPRRGEETRGGSRSARRPAVRGPAGRGRKRAAGTGTHAVAGGHRIPRTGKPNPASSVLKLRGSQLQQVATELLVEVAGPDALPADGDRHCFTGLGASTARRTTSTTARRRSTAAAAKCSATSSRPPFWDCEAAMDFQLTDEQALLRDTTRDLLSRTYDPESRIKVIGSDLGWSREVWSQLADTGILGLGFDPDEAGQIEIMVVLTEVGRRLAPEPILHAALAPGCADRRAGHRRAERTARRRRGRPTATGVRPCGTRPPQADHDSHHSGCAAR